MTPEDAARAARPETRDLPWAAPATLLAGELLALSVAVELPESGSAVPLALAAKKLIPVVIGAGAAALLMDRHARAPVPEPAPAWPGGRPPLPLVASQLAAFAGTAALGIRLLGPGAGPVAAGPFAAWLAAVATTAALAAALVGPPRALARRVARRLGVPLLALGAGLLSWRAVAAAEGLWGSLRGATLAAVAAVLRATSGEVILDAPAAAIGLPSFGVEIAPECSGVDGIGLILLFQAVWLSLSRAHVRAGRAFAVLAPAGVLAAFGANVVRISALILLGAAGREDLALGAFHSKLGWILFLGIAFATIAAAEHLRWFRKDAAPAEPVGVPPAAAAHVAPLLAAIAAGLVTSLWARGGLDPLYGARVLAAGGVLLLVRRALPRPALSVSWVAVALGVAVWIGWAAWGGTPRSTLARELAALGGAERSAWIVIRLVGACLVVPVVEELAFRGFLLPWLAAPSAEAPSPRAWTWPAVLLSSLAFGALHDAWLLGTAAGVAFALARSWRGRLADAVVAHAVANGGLAATALLGGRWDLLG